jgi:hypothetical protein
VIFLLCKFDSWCMWASLLFRHVMVTVQQQGAVPPGGVSVPVPSEAEEEEFEWLLYMPTGEETTACGYWCSTSCNVILW